LDLIAFEHALQSRTGTRSLGGTRRTGSVKDRKKPQSMLLPVLMGVIGIIISATGAYLFLRSGPAGNQPPEIVPTTTVAARTALVDDPITKNLNTSNTDKVETTKPSNQITEARKPEEQIKLPYLEIPSTARALTVDHRLLRIQPWTSGRMLRLYLPPGTHHVIREGVSKRIEIETDFSHQYFSLHEEMNRSMTSAVKRHAESGAKVFFSGSEGLPYHLIGNYYFLISKNKKDRKGLLNSARRRYVQAIKVDPGLAPSHVNLGYIWFELGENNLAAREVLAAEWLNFDNVFGIQTGIEELKRRLNLTKPPAILDIPWESYEERLPEDNRDKKMVQFHQTIMRYSDQAAERAKLLSNLGLYFARQENQARQAEEYYRLAIQELDQEASKEKQRSVFKVVSNNLALLASKYQLPELIEYEALADMNR
jgi:tetratricopeptide (TPR) repeat protein